MGERNVEDTVKTLSSDSDEDDDDDYQPSISDQLHVGYCNMDRACQTSTSDIISLKETTNVLTVLVQDLAVLKKNLYFAKLSLQAEYEGLLQEAVIELDSRINSRIAEIERNQKERVEIVRKSYKTQLSNALRKLSKEYHNFYGNKDANAEAVHNEKIKEMEAAQLALRKNELAQQDMAQMMRMQMENVDNQNEEVPSRRSSVVSTSVYLQEIEDLKSSVQKFEERVDYLEELLEEANNENTTLSNEVETLTDKLSKEEDKTATLTNDISVLNFKMEKQRAEANHKLAKQKEEFQAEIERRLAAAKQEMQEEAQRRMKDAMKAEAEKLRQHKLQEERKMKDLMEMHKEQSKPIEVPVDADVAQLQSIEKRQRAEIARLQRELERKEKMWEMKVKILQEHVHALKDEMFLRTTLQRQEAKVGQATLTYVKKGAQVIPLGVLPKSNEMNVVIRKHQLPPVIQAPRSQQDAL